MWRLTVQIHERDQSKINFALLWENTELITKGLFNFHYYKAQITKNLSTKNSHVLLIKSNIQNVLTCFTWNN